MLKLEVTLRGRELARFELDGDRARIGRHPDNEVQIDSMAVSRHHAQLTLRDGAWHVEDLGSNNGTYVNAARVKGAVALRDGDVLVVGKFHITFRWEPARPARAGGGNATTKVDMQDRTASPIGRYMPIEELGPSGMAMVYRAVDPRARREVTVKLLRLERRHDARETARLKRETGLLARLQHAHIVPVLEVGEHEGAPFIVSELVDGPTLEDRLARDGPLPPAEALRVAEAVARALQHAHGHGVVHRDVRPAAVLLRPDGEPLLSDFGPAPDPGLHGPAGTPGFAPLEQLAGASDAGVRGDVFGLGATLYAMLTGSPPFAAPSLEQLLTQLRADRWTLPSHARPELDAGLDAICARCLAVDPKDRYEDAAALADDLARARRGETPRAVGVARRVNAVDALGALMDFDLSEARTSDPDADTAPPQPSPVAANPKVASRSVPRVRVDDLEEVLATAREAFARGDDARTIAALDRALQLAPDRADLWTMRAVSRRRRGDDRGALQDHEEALRRDPRDAGALVGRGLIRLRQRDHVRAADDLERALELLAPGSPRRAAIEDALRRARAGLGDSVIRGFRVRPDELSP